MPGLTLGHEQAARLFNLGLTTCRLVLHDLERQGHLRRNANGQYAMR